MRYTSASALTVVMLAMVAGTAIPAGAQNQADPTRHSAPRESALNAGATDFRSASWLTDRKVVNNRGEEIASVSNLILNRGSGRVEYMVITTGATLGLGGRDVAIPFDQFQREPGDGGRFVLASTTEQLKQFPEYTPEHWNSMKEPQQKNSSTLRDRLNADAASPSDPYAGGFDNAVRSRVEGEVIAVDRVGTSAYGHQTEITVKAADGSTQRIALGPSWYVNSNSAAPMRGDKVIVETLVFPRDSAELLASTDVRAGNRTLHLRDSDGSPAWMRDTVDADGRAFTTPYSRSLLLSELRGMTVDCRGEECGKVQEIILDRNSGEIAFLSIDPNQNFLGLGDTKRLIPWSVATVALDGRMRIDASKEMVLASLETPSDLSTLNAPMSAERVYQAFGVPAPRPMAPNTVSDAPFNAQDDWSRTGSIITNIDRNSATTFSGKVIEVTDVTVGTGRTPARALRVKVDGDPNREELVLLGPASYMDKQKSNCRAGDAVTVDACRTTVAGQRYWIARSIDWKNSRVVLLDPNYAPAWVQR